LVNKDQSLSNSDMTLKMKSKAKVLIVENEMITANATKRTLEVLNYSIPRIVSSAQEAIKETEENTYDLILMDIKLQGQKDGIKAASRIRARHDIPVIYITALTDKKTLEKAKATNPYGYAHKPVDEKELRTVVEMALFRHEMELQLKKSEDRYRSIFEGSRDAIFIVAEDSRFVEVNEAASALTGYSKDELLKMKIPEIHDAEDLEAYNHYFLRIMSGEPVTSDAKVLKKDGTKVDTEFSNQKTEIGGIPYMHTIARDITERKRAEEQKEVLQAQLIHSEKMAGIGTLTSGVAHEFNNLLQIIKGHMEFAQKTKRSEDIEEAIETALLTSGRAAKIIKDLLIFASDEVSEKEFVPITEIVESALALLEEHIKKHNIEVVRKYQKNPNVEINKAEMQQVFFNLITNSRDAMIHRGGKLEINVNRIEERVEVSFSDTGIGISEKNLGRVFEPFFTTKGSIGGNKIPGTGLGLSVAYGIVKRHAGIIEVKSQEGKGSTVTVKLPIVTSYGREKKPTDKKIRGQKELKARNFLAIDDEEEICRMITKWLCAEGHKVRFVLSGKKAIEQVRKEFFDFIFLDIIMPGMSALDVLKIIKENSPKTKVIVMTGKLIDQILLDEFKQEGASGFLQKPFSIADVNEILQG